MLCDQIGGFTRQVLTFSKTQSGKTWKRREQLKQKKVNEPVRETDPQPSFFLPAQHLHLSRREPKVAATLTTKCTYTQKKRKKIKSTTKMQVKKQ
jgi:hypothetical protein